MVTTERIVESVANVTSRRNFLGKMGVGALGAVGGLVGLSTKEV